jgi:hypothetical protein
MYLEEILDKKEYHVALANPVDEDVKQGEISSQIRKYNFNLNILFNKNSHAISYVQLSKGCICS